MSSLSVEGFLTRLEDSHLLAADRLSDLRFDISHVRSIRTEPLVRRLIGSGMLTGWQVEMLLSGRNAFFLGKYKLLELLGQGGMGVVFKAEHAALGRTVAIKVIDKSRVNNPKIVARFRREIQAAAALDHPNIVVAFDADCVGETHFLVMEYVDGSDLGTLAERRGKLFVDEACEYARQTAVGLQHAHEKGMVHRDIKPNNLVLTFRDGGEPLIKILDMGLAKFVSEEFEDAAPQEAGTDEQGLTQAGKIMGTPDYMAPEQAWHIKDVDIRSDIFSLGCTLFHLVTGRLPFRGASVKETLMTRTNSDAPRLSLFEPDVPLELEAIVGKMLARQPGDRFQSPLEVAEVLEPFCVLPDDVLTAVEFAETPVAVAEGTTGHSAVEVASPPQTSAAPVPPQKLRPEMHIDAALDQFLSDLGTQAS